MRTILTINRIGIMSPCIDVWSNATQSILTAATKHLAMLSIYFRTKDTESPSMVCEIIIAYAAELNPLKTLFDKVWVFFTTNASQPNNTPKKYS